MFRLVMPMNGLRRLTAHGHRWANGHAPRRVLVACCLLNSTVMSGAICASFASRSDVNFHRPSVPEDLLAHMIFGHEFILERFSRLAEADPRKVLGANAE